jgi:hypothetical protein
VEVGLDPLLNVLLLFLGKLIIAAPKSNFLLELKASGTTFSFPGLCQMSTLNKANVSCHLTCFDDNFGWVAKYFKVTLSTPPHPWSLCNGPKS